MMKKRLFTILVAFIMVGMCFPANYEAKTLAPTSKQPTTKQVTYNFKTKKVTVKGKAGKGASVTLCYKNKQVTKKANRKTGNYRISIKIKKSDTLRVYAKERGFLKSKIKKVPAKRYLTASPDKIIAGGSMDDNKVTKVKLIGDAPKNAKVNIRFKGKLIKQFWTKKNSKEYTVYVKIRQADYGKYNFHASAKKKNKKRSKLVTLKFPKM